MARATIFTLAVLPAVLGLELPGGVGRLPALGWNSWNAYYCDVDQDKIMLAANAMVDLGFKDAGYEYVILDDCWSEMDGRDPVTSRLVPNATKFPDLMVGTAAKVHDLGLKYGMYSSAGTMTCGRYPGSLGYEHIDAATFAEWGIDYLKTDFWGRNDPDMLEVGQGNLTVEEERSHFGLWAMMKGPLLMGTDLTKLIPEQIAILQNKYLLAFNQDPLVGRPAKPYRWGVNPDYTFNSTFPAQYWSGPSSKGTLVALFNPTNDTQTMTALYSEIPELDAGGCYDVVDVWSGKDLGCKEKSVDVDVAPHDTAVFLFGAECT
ncbi:hypothetical protein LTR22_012293 [Elasticomyces elasticus]|nr:hypothetical protein LTR22_012293 [Elasticomyces elasticus]